MHAAEAIGAAAVTLGLVVGRPRGLNEGVAALLGAVLVLVLGLVPAVSALRLEVQTWNVFLFFLGMMAVAALADQSGVFDATAYSLARLARGRVVRLYLLTMGLGAVVALLFANDSAALVLTPIVYALVVRLALDPLPFVFATTFIADTASVGLPVSNPLNVIVTDAFHLDLGSYLSHLWLPALLVIAVNVAAFLVIFRRSLTGSFCGLPATKRRGGMGGTLVILASLAVAYLVASALRFPLGIVAVAGACALLFYLQGQGALSATRLGREISWPIFGFIAGMLIVVQGLHNAGVTAALGRGLALGAGHSHLVTILTATLGTAVGSNLVNNLPMALIMVPTIGTVHTVAANRSGLIYSTILGCDLGPNLTHLGSLATFIWLFFLRRKGLEVSTLDYLRLGLMVTPIMLVAAVLGLWVTSGR